MMRSGIIKNGRQNVDAPTEYSPHGRLKQLARWSENGVLDRVFENRPNPKLPAHCPNNPYHPFQITIHGIFFSKWDYGPILTGLNRGRAANTKLHALGATQGRPNGDHPTENQHSGFKRLMLWWSNHLAATIIVKLCCLALDTISNLKKYFETPKPSPQRRLNLICRVIKSTLGGSTYARQLLLAADRVMHD